MKVFVKKIGGWITKLDFFPNTQFITFKGETQYKTKTGGFCSFAIIIVFCILFTSTGLKTINKEIITGVVDKQNLFDPTPLSFSTHPQSSFMFSLFIYGLNLNDPAIKYFDITLEQNYYSPVYTQINSTIIDLVPCSPEHFNFNEDLHGQYSKLKAWEWLCPPLGQDFHLRGKATSDIFASFTISLSKCNSSIHSNCANDTYIDQLEAFFGQFILAIPIINTLVNPSSQDYKKFFIEDRNYFFFTRKIGTKGNAYIEEFQIDTDVSILPYAQHKLESGVAVPQLFQQLPTATAGDLYLQVQFVKSSTTTTYTRTFQKLDTFFSYVGGLIGIILSLIFVVSSYNGCAFSLNIADTLFQFEDRKSNPDKYFNFGYYLILLIKQLLEWLSFKPQWPKIELIDTCLEQMDKQLDITYILKRLIYFERAIDLLIGKEDIIESQTWRKKITLEAAGKIREKDRQNSLQQSAQVSRISAIDQVSKVINIDRIELQPSQMHIIPASSIDNFEERDQSSKQISPIRHQLKTEQAHRIVTQENQSPNLNLSQDFLFVNNVIMEKTDYSTQKIKKMLMKNANRSQTIQLTFGQERISEIVNYSPRKQEK